MKQQSKATAGKRRPTGDERTRPSQDPQRTVAEWVSLGISLAIVLGLVALVLYAYLGREPQPATIEVRTQSELVRQSGGLYYLPLEVTNHGTATAEALVIQVSLTTTGEPETIDFEIPILGGGETQRVVVAFQQDPTTGSIHTAISYLDPD